MPEICPVCGLPKDLCICETIARETQRIKIYVEKRKFGKTMTIIEGIDEKSIDVKKLLKSLKKSLACGGTYKNGKIELQGDHKLRVKKILIKEGFPESSIVID